MSTTPSTPDDQPPLLPGASLPPRVQAHLRESLTLLRDRADDPAVAARIDAVLRGQSSLRDLAKDESFSRMMTPLVERGMARLDTLSPEERARAQADADALERGTALPSDVELGDDGPSPTSAQGTW